MIGLRILPKSRLIDDRRATALVEFAILLPVLLTLYLGGFQMIDASACKRRVTITARSTADLVSQYAIMSEADITNVLGAVTQIMAPYDVALTKVRVSQVTIDANKSAKISWSRASKMSPYPDGTAFTVPAGLNVANSSLVYSEVTYDYYPLIPWVAGAMTFRQTQFMLPRRASTVTLR